MYELITQEAYIKYLKSTINFSNDTLIESVEALLKLLKSEETHEKHLELIAALHEDSNLSNLSDTLELSLIKLDADKPYSEGVYTYFLDADRTPTRATHEEYARIIETYNDMMANMGIPYQAGLGEISVTTADVVEEPTKSGIRDNSSKMYVGNDVPMYA